MQLQETISFKKLTKEDIPLLLAWFAQPHVSKWWPTMGKEETIPKFLKRIRSQDTFGFIVYFGGKPIGYIQYYYINPCGEKTGKWFPPLPAGTVGTDQFIGDPHYIGKGIGTRMLQEFIAYVRKIEPDLSVVIVDPDPHNHAAIRCYEKVGFKKIGVYKTPEYSYLLMQYAIT